MKRYISLLLLFSLLFLSSCSKKDRSAEELFFSLSEKLPPLSAGALYLSGRSAGDDHYMPPSLFAAVFDKDALSYIEEFAIYLSSFALPCEIAIFKCYSPSDCKKAERMCMRRLDSLKRYFAQTEHERIFDRPFLKSSGKTVIFVISPYTEELSDVFRSF